MLDQKNKDAIMRVVINKPKEEQQIEVRLNECVDGTVDVIARKTAANVKMQEVTLLNISDRGVYLYKEAHMCGIAVDDEGYPVVERDLL